MSIYNNTILTFNQFNSLQFKQALQNFSSKDAKIAIVALAIISALITGFYLFKCYQTHKWNKTDPVPLPGVKTPNLMEPASNETHIPPKSPKRVGFNEVRAREFDKNDAPTDIEKISIVMNKL